MKSIFEHIVPRNEFSPPEKVVRSLEENFGTFLNVEWFEEDGLYEAVFYHDEMECIALFDKEGVLQVYKRNLALHAVMLGGDVAEGSHQHAAAAVCG